MSESKRAEIEEKRQKLELLKKKKLMMLQHQQQTKKTAADLTSNLSSILGITPQHDSATQKTGATSTTTTTAAAAPPSLSPPPSSSPSGMPPLQSEAQAQVTVLAVKKRSFTIDLNLAIVDIPPKEITTYMRSTQTFAGGDEDEDGEMSRESEEKLINTIVDDAKKRGQQGEEQQQQQQQEGREIGESIDISADLAALNKKEAEEREKGAGKDKEDKASMIMGRDEANSVMNSFNFVKFFNKTSRCLERAVSINERYPDISKDYLADPSGGLAGAGGSSSAAAAAAANAARYKQALVECEVLAEDKVTRNRSVTCLDWSPENPELLLAGFSASSSMSSSSSASSSSSSSSLPNDSDGVVMVWSVPSALRKSEFTFACQVKYKII